MTILWIFLALVGGLLIGRAGSNQYFLDRIEVLEDLYDDAVEKLNMARRDPITGSSFAAKRLRQTFQSQPEIGGWLPTEEFSIEVKQGRLARAYGAS